MGRWMKQARVDTLGEPLGFTPTSANQNAKTPKVTRAGFPPNSVNQNAKTPEPPPSNAAGAGFFVNRGVLMTVGMCHGYPLLPIKPGVSVAAGYAAWRTFTRDAGEHWLALAVDSVRASWSDDPVTNDLTHGLSRACS